MRVLLLRQSGSRLGKAVLIKPGDDREGPVLVTLAPLATIVGRVEDASGDPLVGTLIQTTLISHANHSLGMPVVSTDERGRFRVADVPAGADYSVTVLGEGNRIGGGFAGDNTVKVRPGETTDIGVLQFKRNSR